MWANKGSKSVSEGIRYEMVSLLVGEDNASGCGAYHELGFTNLTSIPPDREGRTSWIMMSMEVV